MPNYPHRRGDEPQVIIKVDEIAPYPYRRGDEPWEYLHNMICVVYPHRRGDELPYYALTKGTTTSSPVWDEPSRYFLEDRIKGYSPSAWRTSKRP
jgi:hypothetical protein